MVSVMGCRFDPPVMVFREGSSLKKREQQTYHFGQYINSIVFATSYSKHTSYLFITGDTRHRKLHLPLFLRANKITTGRYFEAAKMGLNSQWPPVCQKS